MPGKGNRKGSSSTGFVPLGVSTAGLVSPLVRQPLGQQKTIENIEKIAGEPVSRMHEPRVDNRQLTDSVQLKSVNGVSFSSEVRTAVTIFVTLFRIYVSPTASFARRPISESREAKESHERGTRRGHGSEYATPPLLCSLLIAPRRKTHSGPDWIAGRSCHTTSCSAFPWASLG